jgi:hypothetical protein
VNHYEWPSPDATRAEVDRFIAQHAEQKFVKLECDTCDAAIGYMLDVDVVPETDGATLCRGCFGDLQDQRRKALTPKNGPAVVCCACGTTIPAMGSPLCAGCRVTVDALGYNVATI